MSKTPDHYATLRVPRDATQQQISRAYRALMRSHHPDMEGGGGSARKREAVLENGRDQDAELLQIMQAFMVLRDPVRRADYDRRAAYDRGEGTAATRAEGAAPARGAQAGRPASAPPNPAPQNIPVRTVRRPADPSGDTIRITPVRWESGPYA